MHTVLLSYTYNRKFRHCVSFWNQCYINAEVKLIKIMPSSSLSELPLMRKIGLESDNFSIKIESGKDWSNTWEAPYKSPENRNQKVTICICKGDMQEPIIPVINKFAVIPFKTNPPSSVRYTPWTQNRKWKDDIWSNS